MKTIKKIRYLFLIFSFIFLSIPCFASEEQERAYLIQILNQLNVMQSLIIAAEKEQPKNLRIQFHYAKFRDSQGQLHNGLLDDVQAIKAGIQEKLDQTSVEPRTVSPIVGDYMPINKG